MPRSNLSNVNNVNNRQPQRFTSYQANHREAAGQRTLAVHSRYVKTALVYTAIMAFCLVFCAIYEIFSFGEHSLFMRTMFMIPLLGGAAPFALLSVIENPPQISRGAFNLWNSGLAVHISGCLVHGIIEISGRVCDYDNYYWSISGVFLLLALINQTAVWNKDKRNIRRISHTSHINHIR